MFTLQGRVLACTMALFALLITGSALAQTNSPPVVITNGDMVVPRRASVMLGVWAFDPDGTYVTVAWEQTEGPPVTLDDPTSEIPSFVAPDDATRLRFLVRASDGVLSSEPAAVVVDVRNFAPYVDPARLTPSAPRTADDIVVGNVYAFDPDQDVLTTTYEWHRNGTLVGSQTSATFPASLTTKNDVIMARITVSDGFESTVVEASTTILDSPPVLTTQSPPPTALNYGDTASFTVTATDADDDPVDLEVAYGPAGFTVDGAGQVTWTAAGPLFDRVTEFNWGVRVRGDASLMTGTIEVTDADRLYPLRGGALHLPAQNSGLRIGDFDGNGTGEILIAGARGIYELSWNGSTYQPSWAYPFEVDGFDTYYDPMHAVATRDLDGDGHQEIFFSKGTQLIRLDGEQRRAVARAEHPCFALELADLEGDGNVELVCMEGYGFGNRMKVTVLDPVTLAVIWSSATLQTGISMAVGNVDSDPALEIVTSDGYVFDGQSQQNQWTYGQAFGLAVDTGDLDGDGIEEIVGIVDWAAVRTYSATSLSQLWEYTPGSVDLDAVHVADADGDGRVEILAANGQGGHVMGIGYNAAQNQLGLLWQIETQNSGVTSIAVGNVDADSAAEVVWGVGASSSARDDLVIAGFNPSIGIEWQRSSQPYPDGPFLVGALARIGAGASRLMFTTPLSESGYGGIRALALDSAIGTYEFSRELGSNSISSRAFDVVDFDNDGVDELLYGSSATARSGYFAVYDFATDTIEWQSPLMARSEWPVAMTHADANGDGYQDLIGFTNTGYIYIYDLHARSLLWKSTALGGDIGADIVAADLDGDGESEIVVATSVRVTVVGKSVPGSSYAVRASLQTSDVADLLVSDLDGDDVPQIHVLRSPFNNPSTLYVYDSDLQPIRSVPLGVPANRVFVEESSFQRKNLLIGTGVLTARSTEIWAIDPLTGADVWRSPKLVGQLSRNSLQYVDVDADGVQEISFGTADAMYVTR